MAFASVRTYMLCVASAILKYIIRSVLCKAGNGFVIYRGQPLNANQVNMSLVSFSVKGTEEHCLFHDSDSWMPF